MMTKSIASLSSAGPFFSTPYNFLVVVILPDETIYQQKKSNVRWNSMLNIFINKRSMKPERFISTPQCPPFRTIDYGYER